MAILTGAGIQSPSHAPRRSWQQIFGGRTLASHPALFLQHNLHYAQQGLWIPVATRMTGWGSWILTAARIKADNEKALGQVTIRLNSAMAMLLSTGELRDIATAVARAVTAYGFERLGRICIDALVRTDKAATARVLEKVR